MMQHLERSGMITAARYYPLVAAGLSVSDYELVRRY